MFTGLQVNFHKSMVIGVGTEAQVVQNEMDFMGCKIESFPFKYLGIPLSGIGFCSCNWDLIVDRFERCLTGWIGRFLSFGGKVALISSVLANLPIYYLSIFRIPILVAKKLGSIMAKFLWKGGRKEHI